MSFCVIAENCSTALVASYCSFFGLVFFVNCTLFSPICRVTMVLHPVLNPLRSCCLNHWQGHMYADTQKTFLTCRAVTNGLFFFFFFYTPQKYFSQPSTIFVYQLFSHFVLLHGKQPLTPLWLWISFVWMMTSLCLNLTGSSTLPLFWACPLTFEPFHFKYFTCDSFSIDINIL